MNVSQPGIGSDEQRVGSLMANVERLLGECVKLELSGDRGARLAWIAAAPATRLTVQLYERKSQPDDAPAPPAVAPD